MIVSGRSFGAPVVVFTTIFGNTKIAAALVDETSARAAPGHNSIPPRRRSPPERRGFHFTVPIALLLSPFREKPATAFSPLCICATALLREWQEDLIRRRWNETPL